MSSVGTQRVRATRCLVCETGVSPALTSSLRTGWGVRPRASYVWQSPVRPSQQPTLNRHRGHWNVPWRQSIAAAQRGQDSTAGSGAVSAGGEAAIRRRYATRRTAVEGCGCPVPPRDTHLHGPAALRAARLSALPAPRSGVAQRRASVPGVDTREPRRSRVFTLFLQIAEATSGSAGGVVLLARLSPTSPRLDANPPRHRTLLCPGVQKCPAMATPTDDLCAPVRSHREKRYS